MTESNSQQGKKSSYMRLLLVVVPSALLLLLLIIVGFFFTDLQPAPSLKPISVEEIESTREKIRVSQLSNMSLPTFEGLKEVMAQSLERMPLSHNDMGEIDRVESELCKSDLHLARALKDLVNTPLAGSNPRLRENEFSNRVTLHTELIDDYKRNTTDSEEVKSRFVPILQSVLAMDLEAQRSYLAEQGSSFAQSSDPLAMYLAVEVSTVERQAIATRAMESLKLRHVHAFVRMQIARLAIEVRIPSLSSGIAHNESIRSTSDLFRRHAETPACVDLGLYYLEWFYRSQGGNAIAAMTTEMIRKSDPEKGERDVPESVICYCIGSMFKRLAMVNRGGEFISSLESDKYQEFVDQIAVATQYLRRAWLVDPSRVLFAFEMMNVEMRAGGTGRSTDQWFRHALSAQLDYTNTIELYTMACQPRWGGSDEKLAWLASKVGDCFEVKGDFFIQMHFVAGTLFLDYNRERPLSYPSLVKTSTNLVNYLDRLPTEEPDDRVGEKLIAVVAKILWDAGEFEPLHRFLNRYSNLASESRFADLNLNLELVKDLCGAVGPDTIRAWRFVHRDLFARCQELNSADVEKLNQVLNRLEGYPQNESSNRAIAKCKKICNQIVKYQAGEVVHLDFAPEAANWIIAGRYDVLDSNEIEFTTPPGETKRLLTALPRFSLPYRIEAKVEMTLNNTDPFGIALQTCSMSFGLQHNQSGMQVRFLPRYGRLQWDFVEKGYFSDQRCMHYEETEKPMSATLFIEMTENSAVGGMGESDFEMVKGDFKNEGLVIIGREAMYTYTELEGKPDVKYKISSVMISKLY